MRYGLPDEDIEQIVKAIATMPKVSCVTLFGSRAMGTYRAGSDIDLAIAGEGITFNDISDIYTSLERLGMLYSFDLQNIASITDNALLDHMDRVGKVLFRREG
ncbi:hypothetical protein GCM10023093_18850 [Nemorincola caseinilytica]|uniref:Polymerase beta nucleotidyltransferase domain-containing protein n=1 Tax=Nemorincola caseinilytica TaxID=2054315 RepID=A0ABP8NHD7_9BACT